MIFWVLGGFFFCLKLYEELDLKQGLVPWSCETKKHSQERKGTPATWCLSFFIIFPSCFFLFKWKSSSLNIGNMSINSNSTRWGGFFSPSLLSLVGMEFLFSLSLFSNGKGGNKELEGALTFHWHSFLRHLFMFSKSSTKKRKRRSIGLDFHK